jgi:hypothetical protein
VALRQAWQRRTQARIVEKQEREALEAWDPTGASRVTSEILRRERPARDPHGDLQWTQLKAQQAATLARKPMEEYRVSLLLARIECDLGRHDRELLHAQKLMKLVPQNQHSQDTLQHAACCNSLR